jgi:altronate hydrolase
LTLLLEENVVREQVIREFIEYIISVANGKQTRNEKNGFREISIYKTGILL